MLLSNEQSCVADALLLFTPDAWPILHAGIFLRDPDVSHAQAQPCIPIRLGACPLRCCTLPLDAAECFAPISVLYFFNLFWLMIV